MKEQKEKLRRQFRLPSHQKEYPETKLYKEAEEPELRKVFLMKEREKENLISFLMKEINNDINR